MLDQDNSATRRPLEKRKLVVLKHESNLGNARTHTLFEMGKVSANKLTGRDFSGYVVVVPAQD